MKKHVALFVVVALAACSPHSDRPVAPVAGGLKTTPKGYSDTRQGGWISTVHDASKHENEKAMGGGGREMKSARGVAPSAPMADAADPGRGGEQKGMRASEVDDNATFDQYLKYHIAHSSAVPESYRLDVSERYLIEVVDAKSRPLPNAQVYISGNDKALFEGRTDSRGLVGFYPRTIAASKDVTTFQVTATHGSATKLFELARTSGGKDAPIRLQLATAKAAGPTTLDLCFLIDTTGSMGDEIARIQATLLTITERIRKLESKPVIRLGMVVYKDHGDEYVTQRFDFTTDADAFDKALKGVSAGGGGDEPEQLNMGLYSAVEQMTWSADALRLCFLVADAAPHMDYADDIPYVATLRSAVAKGIKIFPTAASGLSAQGSYVLRQIAQFTLGHFLFIEYGKSAPGHGVEEGTYATNNLDDIVLRIVRAELAAYAS